MEAQFNLLDNPFIPVKTMDGISETVSIREALVNALNYDCISANLPHTNAAVLRLLLAILHRVFGPSDSYDWENLWLKGKFDPAALDSYFQRVHQRFELFSNERPFFQQRHPLMEEKPAQALLQAIGGGDTFTLFDHRMDETRFAFTPPEAALMLITAQTFSLAGLCHPQLKLVFTDGSCSRAVVFFVEGKNLFETLLFNLIRYNRAEPPAFAWHSRDDPPAWEMDDPFHDNRTMPDGYLDYLTWQNRRIQLIPEEKDGQTLVTRVVIAPGLVLNAAVRNPMYHYRIEPANKNGEDAVKMLRFSEGRALWRDSYALLNVNNKDVDVPRALTWMSELMAERILPRRKVRLVAYGMCTEPGKQKVNFYRRDGFEFDDAILQDEKLVGYLNTALSHAEELRRELWSILSQLAELALAPNADLENGHKPDSKDVQNLVRHWDSEGLFWNRLETFFYHFLNNLPSNPDHALNIWNQALRLSAQAAYNQTVHGLGDTPRAMKAAAKTSRRLGYALNKVLGKLPKEG